MVGSKTLRILVAFRPFMKSFPLCPISQRLGLCTFMGRIGSISAPIFFELSRHETDSFDTFIILLIAFLVIVAVASRFALTHETKGVMLVEGSLEGESKGVRRILCCFLNAKLWCLEMSISSRFWRVLGFWFMGCPCVCACQFGTDLALVE